MGRTNARVFPVPVCAVATTSRPSSAGPMARAWMGVGCVKPCFARLLFNGAESENSEKLFIFRFCFEDENRRADYLIEGEGVADQLPVGFIVPQRGGFRQIQDLELQIPGGLGKVTACPSVFCE